MTWAKLDDAPSRVNRCFEVVPSGLPAPQTYRCWFPLPCLTHTPWSAWLAPDPTDARWTYMAYLVGWPADRILKFGVGNSERPRWATFRGRGATVYVVMYPRDCGGVDAETFAETWLQNAGWLPAFDEKSEAAPYLGTGGAGYLECYRAPSDAAYRDGVLTLGPLLFAHNGEHDCPSSYRTWRYR